MELRRYSPLDPPKHRVDAVEAGGLVFVAGMTAVDREGPLRQQTLETLHKIDVVLEAAGTDKSKLVSASVWLNDTADYDAFNEVWNDWIVPGKAPVRACVGVNLALPGLRVEVAVVAAK